MVALTDKNGTEVEVSLDLDKICDYEASHPGWSIIQEMNSFGQTLRFSSLNLLSSFIIGEGGWKAWIKDGFTIKDLTHVINEGLKELGFTSEDGQSED